MTDEGHSARLGRRIRSEDVEAPNGAPRTHEATTASQDVAGFGPHAGAAPARLSAGAAMSLQRRVGNRAVQRLIGPRPADDPWRARYERSTRAPSTGAVQRFKNSDGWFGNKVKFESTAFSASIGNALVITKTGSNLDLGSAAYRPTATATATGAKDQVAKYKLGWVQTVYESNRHFFYSPKGHTPGWGAKILPSFLGERRKVSDTLKTQPVRDGDTGVKPWYEITDAVKFDAAPASTKSTSMYDAPSSAQPWEITVDGTKQYIVKTSGADVFRTWLIARNESTESITRLNYADWKVDYGTDVTPNYANLGASVVTPTTGGAKVTAVEEGTGLKWPLLGDPTANDEAVDKESKW